MPPRTASPRYGGSAGGLLMGAISNMAPDHYRVILSQVPFVDVVTTMLDAEHPADHQRVRRVGQPGKEGVLRLHAVVLALRQPQRAGVSGDVRRHRPVGLAGAVLRAGQVRGAAARPQHLRPAPVVFRTNMDAGHGGKSGRFRRYRERAEMYAFMLDQLGVAAAPPQTPRRIKRSCRLPQPARGRLAVARLLALEARACSDWVVTTRVKPSPPSSITRACRAESHDPASDDCQRLRDRRRTRRLRWAWWLLAYVGLGAGPGRHRRARTADRAVRAAVGVRGRARLAAAACAGCWRTASSAR